MDTRYEVIVMFRKDNGAMLNVYKTFAAIKKHNEGIKLNFTNIDYGHFEGRTAEGKEVRFEIHNILD